MRKHFLPHEISKKFSSIKLQRDSLSPVLNSEGSNGKVRTDDDKGRLCNKFFVSVVTDADYAFFEQSRIHLYRKREISIREAEIVTEPMKLDPNKSRRNDSVLLILLKKISNSMLFRLPLRTSSTKLNHYESSQLLRKYALFPRFLKMGTERKYLITEHWRSWTKFRKFLEKFIFRAIADVRYYNWL